MTDDPGNLQTPETLQTLWQSQPTETETMSLAEIHDRARKFQTKIFRRNTREYILSALVAPLFAWQAVTANDLFIRAGYLMLIAGLAVYAFILHTRGNADRKGADEAGADCLGFHRRSLAHQRDLIRSVWLWGILPVMPGLSVILARPAWLHPDKRLIFCGIAVLVAAMMGGLTLWNLWAAQRLQKRIDELGG